MKIEDRIVIVVDDGIATGSTFVAALRTVKARHPKKIIAALGVAPLETCSKIQKLADEAVCLLTPEDFHAVGQFYRDFSETNDE